MDSNNVNEVETRPAHEPANEAGQIVVKPHDLWDAKFYGRWLLKAAEADGILDALLRDKPKLRKSYLAVADNRQLRPGYIAMSLASRLMGETGLDLTLEAEDMGRGFCALSVLGFFDAHDGLFWMRIPDTIDSQTLWRVTLMLARDFDAESGMRQVHINSRLSLVSTV
jgi:hypothetical protein